jgi:hypothetical protein
MLAFETHAKVFNALVVSCIFELPTLKMMKIVLQVIELVPMHLLVKVNMCGFGKVRTRINLNVCISLLEK